MIALSENLKILLLLAKFGFPLIFYFRLTSRKSKLLDTKLQMLSFFSFYINVLLYMKQEIDLGTLQLLVGPIPVALSHRGGIWI